MFHRPELGHRNPRQGARPTFPEMADALADTWIKRGFCQQGKGQGGWLLGKQPVRSATNSVPKSYLSFRLPLLREELLRLYQSVLLKSWGCEALDAFFFGAAPIVIWTVCYSTAPASLASRASPGSCLRMQGLSSMTARTLFSSPTLFSFLLVLIKWNHSEKWNFQFTDDFCLHICSRMFNWPLGTTI